MAEYEIMFDFEIWVCQIFSEMKQSPTTPQKNSSLAIINIIREIRHFLGFRHRVLLDGLVVECMAVVVFMVDQA